MGPSTCLSARRGATAGSLRTAGSTCRGAITPLSCLATPRSASALRALQGSAETARPLATLTVILAPRRTAAAGQRARQGSPGAFGRQARATQRTAFQTMTRTCEELRRRGWVRPTNLGSGCSRRCGQSGGDRLIVYAAAEAASGLRGGEVGAKMLSCQLQCPPPLLPNTLPSLTLRRPPLPPLRCRQ